MITLILNLLIAVSIAMFVSIESFSIEKSIKVVYNSYTAMFGAFLVYYSFDIILVFIGLVLYFYGINNYWNTKYSINYIRK